MNVAVNPTGKPFGHHMVASVIADVQRIIDRQLRTFGPRKVLEAGCGSATHFCFGNDPYVVGVDVSEAQLHRNDTLREKICADLQTYEPPTSEFGFVICWYVLEHLRRPAAALAGMTLALEQNGLLILAAPSPCSLKGMIAKLTPHWFHVFVYRRLLKRADAGRLDRPPFPTFLRCAIRPAALKRFARENDLDVELIRHFEDDTQRQLRANYKIIKLVCTCLACITRLLTLARLNIYLSDYVFVFRKLPASTSSEPLPALAGG